MRRLLEPIVLTILLAGQVALFTRLLHTGFYFDEGVYLLALGALQSGQDLGTQVFAAQPPVFYGLLQLIASALDPRPETVRVGIMCLSVIGTLGAWIAVRSIAGSLAGLLAVALVIVSPPVPLYAARVLSDLPSLWLVLASIGVAAAGRHRLTLAASLTSGVLIGLATGTKLSAVIAAPLLVAVLARADRPLKAIAGALVGATVCAIAVVAWQIHALPQLMDSVVRYHDAARTTPDVIDRWASIADLFNARTPAFWVVTGGALVFVVRLMRRRCSVAEAAAWAWAGAAFAFLAFHAPLHENHLVVLPIPLAVAAAVSIGAEVTRMRDTWRPVVVLLLALAMAA
ncbi:MAG: glycosyltransferase family 39 protein, partial [Gaiellaceae bacterium]